MFVVSALLPIAALALVGYFQVRGQLETQARDQLAQEVRSVGMGLADQLDVASNTLEQVAGEMREAGPQRELAGVTARRARARFTSLAVIDRGRPQSLWGEPPRADFPRADPNRPSRSSTSLLVDSAGPQVWLVTSIARGSTLWGALDPAYLFHNASERAREGSGETDVCVRAEGIRAPLLCTNPLASTQRLSESWNLFLGRNFGAPSWKVEVAQAMSVVLGPLTTFRRTFLFSILAVLGLVVLLSSVQVRRSLQPLTELSQGTRRLAQHDFTGMVSVKSGDEFEDLAGSFNQMAVEINEQFRTIGAVRDIGQVALVSGQAKEVAAAAANQLRDLLHFTSVDVHLAGERRHDPWSHVQASGERARGERRVSPPESDRDRLRAARGSWLAYEEGFDWLSLPGSNAGALLPLISHDELIGVISLWDDDTIAVERLEIARHLADQLTVGLSNARLIVRLNGFGYGAIAAFGRTVDASSPWTAGHSERVTSLAMRLGSYLGLSDRDMDTLHRGGLLHDIGKIGVPPYILDMAGPLSEPEWVLMRQHPSIGANILAPIAAFDEILPIVRSHHEKLNGSGYPDGLSGDGIPVLARLLAVADVYDALVSDRPYRNGWEKTRAIEQIGADAGSHFDPVMVNAFLAVMASEGDLSRFVLAPLETSGAIA